MRYRSTLLEADGTTAVAELEANDAHALHVACAESGRLLIAATPIALADRRRRQRLNAARLIAFTQSVQTAIAAGVPLLVVLGSIHEEETDPEAKAIHAAIVDAVAQGETLGDAMERFPHAFPKVYVAMVRAGEASGSLESMLDSLESFLEWREDLRRTISQATMYPAIVLTAAYGLGLFLLAFVIPRLAEILTKVSDELPLASRVLIGASDFVATHLIAIVGASIAAVVVIRRALRSRTGATLANEIVVRLPVARRVVASFAHAQMSRTMAVLGEAGLSVTQSLQLVADTLPLPRLAHAVERARDAIVGGAPITQAFRGERLFPPLALSMLQVAEEAGGLSRCFRRLSDVYDREAKTAVRRAIALLEPIVIVFLGLVVGGLAATIITTLYTAMQGIAR
jgi:type II secretory pathway component PulF